MVNEKEKRKKKLKSMNYYKHVLSKVISFTISNIRYKTQRPRLGGRFLTDPKNVFQYNDWDNVEWDEERENEAKKKIKEQEMHPAETGARERLDSEASTHWDAFYNVHQNRFFKDRHWLFTEFPDLAPQRESMTTSPQNRAILEVGCGVGNSVFPILQYSQDSNLFVYCCDFSQTAVDLVKSHSEYNPERCKAFVCDVSKPWNPPFPEGSLDVILLIFVLSAITPERISCVLKEAYKYLKPGGIIFFRDFGLYDMVQLRFKKGRYLSERLYSRGDNTLVYFFTQDEIREFFTNEGFIEEQNIVDRRLQVNRGKQIKMYRIWIQCQYRKPKT